MNIRIKNLKKSTIDSKKIFALFVMFSFLSFFFAPRIIARQPTPMELETIRKETRVVFENFINLWQEEKYFELYEYGGIKSIEQISIEEFATRMVELDWVPMGFQSLKKPKISFRYKTLVYISAEIVFQHKSFVDLNFSKNQSFLLIKEKGKWSFDLIQMIRSPFYSPVK